MFLDKASGKDVNRPQLELMLGFVCEATPSFVTRWTGSAATWMIYGRMILGLTARGVHVRFVKESLIFTGEDSPMANLLLSVMGAFAQFERELIRERQGGNRAGEEGRRIPGPEAFADDGASCAIAVAA